MRDILMSHLCESILKQRIISFLEANSGNCLPDKIGFEVDDKDLEISIHADEISNSFAFMKMLSGLLGSDEISDHQWTVSSGCDTCGHGAQNALQITIKNCNFDLLKTHEMVSA